jgi:hypothetical protein
MVRFMYSTVPYYTKNSGISIYLWSNKFSRQQTDGRQCTVSQQRNRRPRIYDGVDVGKSFQKFQTTTIPIPKRAMVAEENFNRPKSPPKNLVKTI